MAIQIKHNSWLKTRSNGANKYSYTLYGSQEDIEAAYEERQIGAFDPYNDGATVENAVMRKADGSAWYELEITSIIRTDAAGNLTSGLNPGPTETSLSVRTMELPLEACKKTYFGQKYRAKWNFILCGKKGKTKPIWYDDAVDLIIPEADIENYRWIKDVSDLPQGKGADAWQIIKDKEKPGMESFYFPSVEVTERGYHKTALDAAWVVKHAAMRRTPTLGTYGITLGEWLCMGGTAEKSGNIWIATCSYQWSPTEWDHDFYGVL